MYVKNRQYSSNHTYSMKSRRAYSDANLLEALSRVRRGEMSQRSASIRYCIPRATLYDKLSGRREHICRMGPSPYLTMAEEMKISRWAIQMARVGCGRTRRQVIEVTIMFLSEGYTNIILHLLG